ncbi:MAG: DnaJ C-terminal domain-containing protein [Gammaproteobacteria bacterium]
MEYKDYYKIMGVGRDATQDEIKRAYRKLARKYHPDVSKEADAEARFKEVGEAYEVLKDPEKRAAYDQLGANWKAGQEFRPPPDWDAGFEFSGGGFTGGDASAFSDFFETLFGERGTGGGFRQTRGGFSARGEDHHAKILIDLDDAFEGATRAISLTAPSVDSEGHLRTRQRTLNVRIPKGIRPGQHIRLAGQGTPGLGGGSAGDLYLEVEFRPHPLYRVEAGDLYLDLPLAPWEAALGAKVEVPTPAGAVDLTIPPNTAAGRKLRLKGRGLPGKSPGDLYATAQIVTPVAETEDQKAAYRRFADAFEFDPRSRLGSRSAAAGR